MDSALGGGRARLALGHPSIRDRGRLARDVERHLADGPIDARPPGRAYRLRKFFRRNRGPLAAAGLIVAARSAGTAAAGRQAIRATKARRLADARADRIRGDLARLRTANVMAERGRQDRLAHRCDEAEVALSKSGLPAPGVTTIGKTLHKAREQLPGGVAGFVFVKVPPGWLAMEAEMDVLYRAAKRFLRSTVQVASVKYFSKAIHFDGPFVRGFFGKSFEIETTRPTPGGTEGYPPSGRRTRPRVGFGSSTSGEVHGNPRSSRPLNASVSFRRRRPKQPPGRRHCPLLFRLSPTRPPEPIRSPTRPHAPP